MPVSRSARTRSKIRKRTWKLFAKFGTVSCFVCGKEVFHDKFSVEHILPKSHGGTDDPTNLAISHERCNRRRGKTAPGTESPPPYGLRPEGWQIQHVLHGTVARPVHVHVETVDWDRDDRVLPCTES